MHEKTTRVRARRVAFQLMILALFASTCLIVPLAAEMTSISPCPLPMQDEMSQLYINAVQSRGSDGSCDANCEKQYDLLNRKACEYASTGNCYSCDPKVCSKYGIVCKGSSPSPTQVPPPDGDGTWILVIGVIGVLGVGVVVGAKLLGGKKPDPVTPGTAGQKEEKKKEKKKEESVTYILQLSANHVSVTPDESASLTIAVWKKVGDSPPVPEPGAFVTLENPADSGLSVTPSKGNSPLQAEIALAGEMKRPSVTLGITATAGGTTKKAEVTVDVSSKTRIEFT
jgi:hypothetical protein